MGLDGENAHVIHLLLANIQKAFLQIGMRKKDRDAFPFFSILNGERNVFDLPEPLLDQSCLRFSWEQCCSTTVTNSQQMLNQQ